MLRTFLITTLALGALAAPAGAAVQLGELAPTALQTIAGPCTEDHAALVMQHATPPGTASFHVPPGGGVITELRMRRLDGTVGETFRFRVFRQVLGTWSSIAGIPGVHGTGPITRAATRVPVIGGEALGFSKASGEGELRCLWHTGRQTDKRHESYSVVDGASDYADFSPFQVSNPHGEYRVNVAATLEPDADRDGFGDESQDGCPTDKATQGACPPPPAAPPQPQPPAAPPAPVSDAPQPRAATTAPVQLCRVPSLRGLSRTTAARRLAAAGCRIGRAAKPKRVPRGAKLRVRRQSIPAGTQVVSGTKLDLTLRAVAPRRRR